MNTIKLESLPKWSPAIRNAGGQPEAAMCQTNVGEYVKLSDVRAELFDKDVLWE